MKDQKRNQKKVEWNGKISSFTSKQTERDSTRFFFCSFTDVCSCVRILSAVRPSASPLVRPFALLRVTCFTVEWPSIVLDSLWPGRRDSVREAYLLSASSIVVTHFHSFLPRKLHKKDSHLQKDMV